jgi:hypothetical protein
VIMVSDNALTSSPLKVKSAAVITDILNLFYFFV